MNPWTPEKFRFQAQVGNCEWTVESGGSLQSLAPLTPPSTTGWFCMESFQTGQEVDWLPHIHWRMGSRFSPAVTTHCPVCLDPVSPGPKPHHIHMCPEHTYGLCLNVLFSPRLQLLGEPRVTWLGPDNMPHPNTPFSVELDC